MARLQSTFDLDARIRAIASNQLGLVTVAQATRCGIDKHALAGRRDSGALVPLYPNVMKLAPFATTPQQRVLGAALAVPGSVIAATSAAIVHQMPVPARVIHDEAVLSVASGRAVRVPGITVVRQRIIPPSKRWMTTRLATPAAAVLLLPRFVDAGTVERCLDHCLAHRLTSVANLRAMLDATAPHAVFRRQLLLDLLADRTNGIGHRSGKEQMVGRWLNRAGLTGWTRNYSVRIDSSGQVVEVEVDFGWPNDRVALEVSPFFTHGSRVTQDRDAERRRLLAVATWRVVEAVDADLANERAFARIVATLRATGLT